MEGSMTSPPQPADGATDLPTLAVEGELDLAVAPWLRDQLDALYVGGADSIVVDLSAATFLDSTSPSRDSKTSSPCTKTGSSSNEERVNCECHGPWRSD